MLGFTVRSLGTLPLNTPFVRNGHHMLKVAHPTYGFAARTGDGQTVVLSSKTPVHVAQKPVTADVFGVIRELERIRRVTG